MDLAPFVVLAPIAFAAGILIQAFLIIGQNRKDFFGLIVLSLLGALLVFMPGKGSAPYDMGGRLAIYPVIFLFLFIIMFAMVYRNKILQVINEQTLLSFTIITWFVILKYQSYFICAMPVAIIGLIATLAMSFTYIRPGRYFQAFLYAWFIFMAFMLCIFQLFSTGTAHLVTDFPTIAAITPEQVAICFLGGMNFVYLSAYGLYLFDLVPVPFPGRYQTASDRIRLWQESIDILEEKYSEEQMKPGFALLLIIAEAGILVANHLYPVVSDFLLITIFIFLSQVRLPISKVE